jgi:transposase
LRNVHQKLSPQVLLDFLQKNYPGATFKTAYEAGKFGFWIHRQLTAFGIECLVVTRCKNRIKGLLAFSGIDLPTEYDNACWSKNFIIWLNKLDCKQVTRRKVLDFMISQMEFLRDELLKISNEIRKMLREQRYNKNYYLLRSILGIGPFTAGQPFGGNWGYKTL